MRNTGVPSQNDFFGAKAKLTIASIDHPTLQVPAQYNPKELQLTMPVTWTASTAAHHDAFELAYGGEQPQTTQIELFFDGYECKASVQTQIEKLKTLARPQNPDSTVEHEARPHLCQVTWGKSGNCMPPLYCVIESLVTKYVMFADDGTPLRATCTISVKECRRIGKAMLTRDGREVRVA